MKNSQNFFYFFGVGEGGGGRRVGSGEGGEEGRVGGMRRVRESG